MRLPTSASPEPPGSLQSNQKDLFFWTTLNNADDSAVGWQIKKMHTTQSAELWIASVIVLPLIGISASLAKISLCGLDSFMLTEAQDDSCSLSRLKLQFSFVKFAGPETDFSQSNSVDAEVAESIFLCFTLESTFMFSNFRFSLSLSQTLTFRLGCLLCLESARLSRGKSFNVFFLVSKHV